MNVTPISYATASKSAQSMSSHKSTLRFGASDPEMDQVPKETQEKIYKEGFRKGSSTVLKWGTLAYALTALLGYRFFMVPTQKAVEKDIKALQSLGAENVKLQKALEDAENPVKPAPLPQLQAEKAPKA